MKEQILEEFEDKYSSFELCNQVSKPELDKLKDFLSQTIDKTREETIREVLNIELAPDIETIQTINYCKTKSEAFGYGQGWVMKRVEDLLNKLKK